MATFLRCWEELVFYWQLILRIGVRGVLSKERRDPHLMWNRAYNNGKMNVGKFSPAEGENRWSTIGQETISD